MFKKKDAIKGINKWLQWFIKNYMMCKKIYTVSIPTKYYNTKKNSTIRTQALNTPYSCASNLKCLIVSL